MNTLQGTPNQRAVGLSLSSAPTGSQLTLSPDGGVSAYNLGSDSQAGGFISNGQVTITPGVILKGTLTAHGSLTAIGTADNPIIFTDPRDDRFGGDTNGDGAYTTATPFHGGTLVDVGRGKDYKIEYALFDNAQTAIHVAEFTLLTVNESKIINTTKAFDVARAGTADQGTSYFYNTLPCAPLYDSQVIVNNTWFGSTSLPGVEGDLGSVLGAAFPALADLTGSKFVDDVGSTWSAMSNQWDISARMGTADTRPWAIYSCGIPGIPTPIMFPVTPVMVNYGLPGVPTDSPTEFAARAAAFWLIHGIPWTNYTEDFALWGISPSN
ncbi:hypothetical protein [Raineyella fluvialis]|uniref:Uncharacterized protein n=1 Tax=Raineyella fluvialis TaxID=2662261 RepID=A0A5Q2F9B6_9ACTN|nr:hypothetical protein [Raineyella fluvialis]QGF22337.1 hypothetical protein Rai3103_00035 [Raineyella fluvialis]